MRACRRSGAATISRRSRPAGWACAASREMIAARGVPMLVAAFDDIIRRTRERLLEALTRIPPGEYTFEDVMDDDGVGTTNIPIRVAHHRAAARRQRNVLFDFTGTGAAGEGQHQRHRHGDARAACSIR